MVSVTAAGGVLFRVAEQGVEVLLIRRNGVWDLPKGKLEPHEHIQVCACREVAEEVGIAPPLIACGLGTTHHGYHMGDTDYAKTTHWYLMVTSARRFRPQKEELIEGTRWLPLHKALTKVGFENLRIVLQRARDVLESISPF